MKSNHEILETEKPSTSPSTTPLFRRYQIKVKAGVRTGALPVGEWPIGF